MAQMTNLKHVLPLANSKQPVEAEIALATIQRRLLLFSVFNLLLTSIIGVALRLYPLLSIPFVQYKNLLHAHSHFAFGGWVMPILLTVILKYFPELTRRIPYRHLRNISVSILFSAYGMLLSFPFRGYAAVSIGFSTLSIFAGFYMVAELWKAARGFNTTSILFLKAGLVYLVISAIGPFATAPLIAAGKAGTPLYYNAIYFYLHFQYNGWFSFAILSVLYKMMEKNGPAVYGKLVYRLFTIACMPACLLSTLWGQPHAIFYVVAMIAAVMQIIAVIFLLKDIKRFEWKKDFADTLIKTAIFFFVVKNVLQLLSAVPAIADLAYTHRNFIIAYLHMVLLGFISLGAFAVILKGNEANVKPAMRTGLLIFLAAFILTEAILVLNAAEVNMQIAGFGFQHLLLFFSVLFPVAFFLIWNCCRKLF